MHRNKINYLALALIGTLLIALIASCGGSGGNVTTVAATEAATTAAAATEAATSAATTAAGAAETTAAATAATTAAAATTTVQAASQDPGAAIPPLTDPLANTFRSSQIVKEPGSVTLTCALSQNANVSSYEDNFMTSWLQEQTGINIEFELFPSQDALTKLDLMASSGDPLPDIINIGMGDNARVYNYGVNGAIAVLDDYFDRLSEPFYERCDLLGWDWDDLRKMIKSADGHNYTIPYRDNNLANYYSLRGFINKTWLDKLGLQPPTDYLELITVLTAFRDQDPNGNGLNDEIPMMGGQVDGTGSWQADAIGYLTNMFIYNNDTGDRKYYLPLSETGGKIDVSYDKPEFREALIYINGLVKDGLLSPQSFTQDNAQFSALKRADPPVIGLVITGGAVDLYFGNSTDEYVPYEVMKGPKGVQWQTASLNAPRGNSAISADCEHPEIAFLFQNYPVLNEDAYMLFFINRWGIPDVDWRFAEPGEKSMFDMEGYPPKLKLLNSTWGALTNSHWQGGMGFANLVSPLDLMEVFDGNPDNDEYQYAVNYSYNKQHAPAFESIPPPLVYTVEESDQWNDARTVLRTYILEARSLFAIGQLDPNNDNDWNNFLNELDKLQYKELIAVDQTAYDRMMGN